MNNIYVSLKESTLLKIKIKKRAVFKTPQTYKAACMKHEKEHIPRFSYFNFV